MKGALTKVYFKGSGKKESVYLTVRLAVRGGSTLTVSLTIRYVKVSRHAYMKGDEIKISNHICFFIFVMCVCPVFCICFYLYLCLQGKSVGRVTEEEGGAVTK